MTTRSHASPGSSTRRVFDRLRDELRDRRQAGASYRHLQRELSHYRRPSEIGDLLAAVDRQDDSPQAAEIRGILAQNLADYRRSQRFAS